MGCANTKSEPGQTLDSASRPDRILNSIAQGNEQFSVENTCSLPLLLLISADPNELVDIKLAVGLSGGTDGGKVELETESKFVKDSPNQVVGLGVSSSTTLNMVGNSCYLTVVARPKDGSPKLLLEKNRLINCLDKVTINEAHVENNLGPMADLVL